MANSGRRAPHENLLPARSFTAALTSALMAALALAACRKSAAPSAAPDASAGLTAAHVDVIAISGRIGVKPGPLTHEGVGPAAALMESLGTVSVRRVGEERFEDATPNMPFYSGDEVWAGPHAQATIAFADETLVELGEETAILIGNRAVASDPASSVAVLYGVARLSISPRARGEGAFLTTAGGTIVGAKGTAIGVGVAAGGFVRVGIEHGEAEVVGPSALDKPITLETEQVVDVDPKGVVGTPAPFKSDDWGDWRYALEAKQDLAATARYHADHLVGAEARLDADYLSLLTVGTRASTLTWQAEASAKSKNVAEFKSTAVERGASLEAMYRLATELARLTAEAASHELILAELYARHPKDVEGQYLEFAQEMVGALLDVKKLQLVSEVFFTPLRPAFYAYTARGRASAANLDLPPPAFAQVKLVESAAEIAKRVPAGLYVPPRLDSTAHGHPVWQRAPAVGWNDRLTLQPVPTRESSWYVAPVNADAKLVVGVPSQGAPALGFPPAVATAPENADLVFLIPPFPPVGTIH